MATETEDEDLELALALSLSLSACKKLTSPQPEVDSAVVDESTSPSEPYKRKHSSKILRSSSASRKRQRSGDDMELALALSLSLSMVPSDLAQPELSKIQHQPSGEASSSVHLLSENQTTESPNRLIVNRNSPDELQTTVEVINGAEDNVNTREQEENDFLIAFKLQQEEGIDEGYDSSRDSVCHSEDSRSSKSSNMDNESKKQLMCQDKKWGSLRHVKLKTTEDKTDEVILSNESCESLGASIDDSDSCSEVEESEINEEPRDQNKEGNSKTTERNALRLRRTKEKKKVLCREGCQLSSTSSELPLRNLKNAEAESEVPKRCERPLAVEDENIWNEVCTLNYIATQGGRARDLARPSRLTEKQLEGLKWARRFLFSALIGSGEVLNEDPPTIATATDDTSNSMPSSSEKVLSGPDLGFTSARLFRVLRAVNVPVTEDEVVNMMKMWQPHCCDHRRDASPSRRLCKRCWVSQEGKNKSNQRKKSSRLESSSSFFDTSRVCDWEQFCWIFDDCNLKAEKNGKVW